MKAVRTLALAAALFAIVPAAQAQVVNLSKMSCKEFVGLKPEAITMLWAWLYGYYADEDADPIIDFDKLTAKGAALAEACRKTPDKDIISAAEPLYEK
jgi:acid stress chaperone HdeB